jgi:hypothetical protein
MLWLALHITQNVVASSLSNRRTGEQPQAWKMTLGIEKVLPPYIIAP